MCLRFLVSFKDRGADVSINEYFDLILMILPGWGGVLSCPF